MLFIRSELSLVVSSLFLLSLQVSSPQRKKLNNFDVDNTRADTWPSYLLPFPSFWKRLYAILPFPAVSRLVREKNRSGEPVVFFAARGYRYYWVIMQWLEKQGIFRWNLFLVRTSQEKVELVKLACRFFKAVELYDDISYNHEKGEVKFYDDCIQELQKIPNLAYHGYSELLQLQGKEI